MPGPGHGYGRQISVSPASGHVRGTSSRCQLLTFRWRRNLLRIVAPGKKSHGQPNIPQGPVQSLVSLV